MLEQVWASWLQRRETVTLIVLRVGVSTAFGVAFPFVGV